MAKEKTLTSEVLHWIERIKEADILIGIPSYNNARTIGQVIRAVNVGVNQYFSQQKCVIVNSDWGSRDETPAIVQQAMMENPGMISLTHSPLTSHGIMVPYHRISGKAGALRMIFEVAEDLNAKACAVMDADLRSIAPEWVESLIKPIMVENFDYVTPFYFRHKYDGTITSSIIYPLTRALYGQRVCHPIGGDFGLSARLVSNFLAKEIWHSDVAWYAIDLWMTTTAVAEGFRVCQSFLGSKIHESKNAGRDLSIMLTQVVGSAFSLMETYQPVWPLIKGSEPTPIYGHRFEIGLEPINVNLDRMITAYKQGVTDLSVIWEHFLPQSTLSGLKKLAASSDSEFHFPDALWANTVYDFAAAYFKNRMDRDHLIKSITPLYLGRTASFVIETQNSTASQVENKVELLCLEYENLKPYLIERWRS